MINKLQRRLILQYTLTTGIILTLVVLSLSLINYWNFTRKTNDTLQNHFINISTKLQTDSVFHVSWLAAMESENNLIIHIEENGNPLLYRGSWKPLSDRNALISQAKAQAKNLHTDLSVRPLSSASISPVFTIKGRHNDQYQCMAVSYPQTSGYKSMILLYDTSSAVHTLQLQCLLFILADILGIFALYFAAGKLVRKTLKPLAVSQQKQQEFVAAASHELRSPLMVIQSSAQAIESVPEKSAQFTGNITKECKRMSHLIDEMLTLASLDVKNRTLRKEPLDPNTLLIDLYELYEPVYSEKQMPLQLRLPNEQFPPIQGNREHIVQIVSILLDNALSYNNTGQAVTLEASMEKSSFSICVADHGCGIPDSEKELVFDRFYRLDKSRKDKQHFGLGLSIAKELAFLYHGSLRVQNSDSGGSTFVLKLPLS